MKTPILLLAFCLAGPAIAQSPVAPHACELTFSSSNWWPLYRGFTGDGTVHCRDGLDLRVHVIAQGHGLSIDHWKIRHATGRYSQLGGAGGVLGHYVRTRDGTRLVRNGRSGGPEAARPHLALDGRGDGFEADDDIDDLRIERAEP